MRVLEFGPGTSTSIVLRETKATIVSIEESHEWYRKYRAKFSDDRVELHHKEPGWDLEQLEGMGGPYDLIFVDGGNRTEELKRCAALLAQDGVVYLHDAHREEYEPGIRSYPHVFFPERHSCMMFRSEDVYRRIQSLVPQDWNCRCKYCDTPERHAYLAQFQETV